MSQAALNRVWVVMVGVLLYALLLGYGVYGLLQVAPRFSNPMQAPPEPVVRGSFYAADGTPLAFTDPNGQRQFPLGPLAGQLLGFNIVSNGPDNGNGLEGLEGSLDARLDLGENLTLTVNPTIQAIAERALWQSLESAKAEWGSVIVMESHSGKLLAVANGPTFDPSNTASRQGVRWRNHAFTVAIEPGSTIKALTAAALLNEGLASLGSYVKAPMSRQIDRWTISDPIKHPPDLTLKQVLEYSSNVGISLLAERMAEKTFYKYLLELGLNQSKLMPGVWVARPQVRRLERWGPVEYANATYGQGFLVTPLHLTAAMNALANQGRYVAPQIVEDQPPAVSKPVFQPEVAQQILRALAQNNVSEASIAGYDLGGKTGTAQVVIRQRYSKEVYTALFAGYIPAQNPKVTVVVAIYHPKGKIHGSQVAAPVYRQIAERLLAYWGIPPKPQPLQ